MTPPLSPVTSPLLAASPSRLGWRAAGARLFLSIQTHLKAAALRLLLALFKPDFVSVFKSKPLPLAANKEVKRHAGAEADRALLFLLLTSAKEAATSFKLWKKKQNESGFLSKVFSLALAYITGGWAPYESEPGR